MRIRVESIDFFERPTSTRLPFHFGAVTMRQATTWIARLRASAEGVPCVGYAADLLVPRWFDKDPARGPLDDERNLKLSSRLAGEVLLGQEAGTVFELWHATYAQRQARALDFPGGGLAVGFGVALVERALIDAACRAAQLSFSAALRGDLFAYRPAELHAELADWDASELGAEPRRSIAMRHTVGMLDPLDAAERPAAERIDDGLPETLEEDVARYGLRRFKVKLGGEPAADLGRLQRLAERLPDFCQGQDFALTLDANEQYASTGPLLELLDELALSRSGGQLLERLLFIEQPIPRALSLDPELRAPLEALRRHAPCILDEADGDLDAFPRAALCGWRGVSVKCCKGVFRALTNRGLCALSRGELFQSGEDLTNLPVLPLQQDLTLAASLGLEDVERNGHHYFHGLDHLPQQELEQALTAHPELYRRAGTGAELRIEEGRLALDSLDCIGFGHALDPQLEPEPSASIRRAAAGSLGSSVEGTPAREDMP